MKLLSLLKELSLHPKNTEELKGLILQLAVEGKLTANWRKENSNIEPASELLKQIGAEKQQLIVDKKIKKDKPLNHLEDKEIPYELPHSWTWCRLGDISTLINGDRGKNYPSKDQYIETGIPFITARNLGDRFLKHDKLNYISEERFALLRSGQVEMDDILYCLRGSLGKCAIVEGIENGAIASSLCIVRVFSNISSTFLLNYFLSPLGKEMILRHDNGTAQPNLSATDVKTFVFPLPPLEEQKAIVEVVNTLLKEVEALENLTKERISLKEDFVTSALRRLTETDNTTQEWNYLQQHFSSFFTEKKNIKSLRETILQLAVQGKLTAQWREENPSLENASELLKRIKTEKLQLIAEKKIRNEKPRAPILDEELPFALSSGWAWCRLRDLVSLLGDGIHGTPNYTANGPVHFVNGNNLNDGVIQIKSNTKTVSEEEALKHHRILNNRSVLVSINGSIGYTAFYNGEKVMLGKSACYFNLLSEINKEYIRQLIKSEYFRNYAFKSATGTTIKNVSLRTMRGFVVPLPSIQEQKAIVEKVNSLMVLCDELEQQVDNSHIQIEQLMQSCLKEVFEEESN